MDFLQDLVAREEAERTAARLDWDRLVAALPPAPEWFEGEEPKPF